MLLNPNQKLNSLAAGQIEHFDCIIGAHGVNGKDILSYEKNEHNLWLNIEKLEESLKLLNRINQYILIDKLFLENLRTFETSSFQLKLLYNSSAPNHKLLHIFVGTDKCNLAKVYNQIVILFRSN